MRPASWREMDKAIDFAADFAGCYQAVEIQILKEVNSKKW
jgi:hypothetical protein